MDRVDDTPSVATLIDIWQEAVQSLTALCAGLDELQWQARTPCPGWTVADVAAHTIDIERFLAGDPRPEHEPDWASLPHITGDFGRFTEVGVDARRCRSQAEVLEELLAVTATRRAVLDAVPEGAEVMGVQGTPTTMERMLRVRIFDIWAHEQDVRAAIGRDGHWDTRPARIAFQQVTRSLPYVWSRAVGAPVGAVVVVSITGPSLGDEITVVTESEGVGRVVDRAAEPTVWLTASWPDYARLACGRVDVDDPALRSRLVLAGERSLGDRLLRSLAITP